MQGKPCHLSGQYKEYAKHRGSEWYVFRISETA